MTDTTNGAELIIKDQHAYLRFLEEDRMRRPDYIGFVTMYQEEVLNESKWTEPISDGHEKFQITLIMGRFIPN